MTTKRRKAKEYRYEILDENGMVVAAVCYQDAELARREAGNYAMIYAQYGPVKIKGPKGGRK